LSNDKGEEERSDEENKELSQTSSPSRTTSIVQTSSASNVQRILDHTENFRSLGEYYETIMQLEESEMFSIRVHVALVNNGHIRLGVLKPFYNDLENSIMYTYDQNVKSFDLQSGSSGIDIENAFNLIVYLRQVVCRDASS
ncbi:9182_t:CDS:2, partial [Racocetra fulgida]